MSERELSVFSTVHRPYLPLGAEVAVAIRVCLTPSRSRDILCQVGDLARLLFPYFHLSCHLFVPPHLTSDAREINL